jgi:hypothetical protein
MHAHTLKMHEKRNAKWIAKFSQKIWRATGKDSNFVLLQAILRSVWTT